MAAARQKFVEPMKAAVAAAPPHNGLWLYEVKFDEFPTNFPAPVASTPSGFWREQAADGTN